MSLYLFGGYMQKLKYLTAVLSALAAIMLCVIFLGCVREKIQTFRAVETTQPDFRENEPIIEVIGQVKTTESCFVSVGVHTGEEGSPSTTASANGGLEPPSDKGGELSITTSGANQNTSGGENVFVGGESYFSSPSTDFDKNVYVSEFSDSWLVDITPTTEAVVSAYENPPALVTGFSGTSAIKLTQKTPVSVFNLNFPSKKGLSKEELEGELDSIVSSAKRQGLNTIFFQVRPSSDALYFSDIFPTSKYISGNEGDSLETDPLGYLINAAHKEGIKVFAWVNPYRVTTASDSLSSLSAENPAVKYPELTYTVGDNLYYKPSSARVRALVAEGIAEIVNRYDVDGVVLDDYFYPSEIGDEDKDEYSSYLASGGGLSLADFRRENVNLLIELCYRTVKSCDKSCLFGVSPRGIWRNSSQDPEGSDTSGSSAYDEIYCDALAWVEGGYVDFLSPQIYWSFSNKTAPFATLADWWRERLSKSSVILIPSLAGYYLSEDEISAQKSYLEKNEGFSGYVIYSYSSIS